MKNAFDIRTKSPKEWGRAARKAEGRERGFRRRGREDAIRESLNEMSEEIS